MSASDVHLVIAQSKGGARFWVDSIAERIMLKLILVKVCLQVLLDVGLALDVMVEGEGVLVQNDIRGQILQLRQSLVGQSLLCLFCELDQLLGVE